MKIGCCLPGDDILENAEGKSAGEKLYLKDRYVIRKGFDYSEVGVSALMALTEEEIDFLAEKKKTGEFALETCNGFIPGTFKIAQNGTEQSLCDYVEKALSRAERLQVEYIVFGSGQARRIEEMDLAEGMRQIAEFLMMCDEKAAKHNVTIVIEPLNHNETNIFYTVRSSAHMLSVLNTSHVKLLADAYHMLVENEPLEDLQEYRADLKHTHIAEGLDREAPGLRGGEYLKEFAARLKSSGYQGRVSCECRWKNVPEEIDGVQAFMHEYFHKG